MLSNYLKLAFRNLLRQKFYTAINVAGLTLGVAPNQRRFTKAGKPGQTV